MIKSYPKIHAIGSRYIKDIFSEEVIIEEKIDGSMFAFGWVNGEFLMRSKNRVFKREDLPENDSFVPAADYVESIKDRLIDNMIYYGEYLRSPKHNSLKYNRIPENHIAIFGRYDLLDDTLSHTNPRFFDEAMNLECAPVLFKGKINHPDELKKFLEYESFLGGTKIEGVVVKNYHRSTIINEHVSPAMFGKCVSESFKEVNRRQWEGEKPANKLESFYDSFRTEARWNKAFQHLRESWNIDYDERDIGRLVKEVHADIESEEKENIKDWLWLHHKNDINKTAVKGLAQWYKNKLMMDTTMMDNM